MSQPRDLELSESVRICLVANIMVMVLVVYRFKPKCENIFTTLARITGAAVGWLLGQ